MWSCDSNTGAIVWSYNHMALILPVPPCGCLGARLGSFLQGTLEGSTQAGRDPTDVGIWGYAGYGDMVIWRYGDMLDDCVCVCIFVESEIFLRLRFCWTSLGGRPASIPTSRFPQLSTTWDKWLVLVFNSLASNPPNFRPPSTACYSPNSLPRRFEIHSFLHFVTFFVSIQ